MSDHLRYGFLHNHHRLVRQLELDSLFPYLIAKELITMAEKELIQNEPSSSSGVDKLLTILHRRGNTDPSVFKRFLQLLADPDVVSGQNLGGLVQSIRHDSDSQDIGSKYSYSEGVLLEGHNAALREHEEALVSSMSVSEVLPELVARGVVSAQENDEIRSESIANTATKRLLDVVERRGSVAFSHLVSVLRDSETQSHLGNLLSTGSGGTMDDKHYVEAVTKEGHVPPQPKVYLERKDLIEKIRTELRKLKDGDRWVVVHGLAGFGKTVAAAEAIRHAPLLREVFPGGVNWLTVGQMRDPSGDLDTAKLLNKLQTLILRLDEDKSYRPPSVEAATDYLQEVISKQHPQSLLILDDVWTPDVAQAFSARCRVMVTSRNASVAEKVITSDIHTVSVSEGLSEDAARNLLANWLKKDPAHLSPHADTIIECCRGSPMAIGLIGAVLKRSNTEARWREIAERLKKKPFYNFNASLKDSIELSVESLPSTLKTYFEMLVVLDYDTLITREALDTIWNTDSFDTEDYMRELVGYSLAQQANPGADDQDLLIYYIHDIVLDYLKDSISPRKQMELHALVVKRYGDKCDGAYPKLEDDRYVYQKLMGHLAAAGNYELLGDLMTQLRWLMSVIQYGDANTYLANYRHFKDKVPEQFKMGVQQFELFLSGHMYVLANQASLDDIIQLALLLPDTSEVFKQAAAMTTASIGRKRSWFRWSNKWSDPEKYALKLKLHHEGVSKCCFSQDESKVLSCAGNEVKLWDSTTGMVQADYKGHKDHVTCCDLSPSGKLVVSSSEDCTVKVFALSESEGGEWAVCEVWKLEDAHDSNVLKIYFSPKNNKFISCSNSHHKVWLAHEDRELASSNGRGLGVRPCVFFSDSVRAASSVKGGVMVWNTNTGATLKVFAGVINSHKDNILCVDLSTDNTRLAASATDGTVMVWDIGSGTLLFQSEQLPLLPCARSCALSPHGSKVAAGYDDGSLRIWDINKRKPVNYCPTESDYWMIDLAFSPDGSTIVTLCDSIEWWRSDGTHTKRVMLKGTFGKYIRFSPDFMTFVTIDNAGLLYIFTIFTQT